MSVAGSGVVGGGVARVGVKGFLHLVDEAGHVYDVK